MRHHVGRTRPVVWDGSAANRMQRHTLQGSRRATAPSPPELTTTVFYSARLWRCLNPSAMPFPALTPRHDSDLPRRDELSARSLRKGAVCPLRPLDGSGTRR